MFEDAFEFIIDSYESLHNIVFMQQHRFEFVTFVLVKGAKKW